MPGKLEEEYLLTTRQVAHLLGLSHRSVEGLRLTGGGPPFVRLGRRAVRYRRRDVEAWIELGLRTSTSQQEPTSPNPQEAKRRGGR